MTESATQNASTALYHYLCQNTVGTEEQVKTTRMMNTVRDNLCSIKTCTVITSGSFGEGLEMRGSDIDVMAVIPGIEVCEDTHTHFNANKIHLTMEMDDTQPGFTMLRVLHSYGRNILEDCDELGSDFYFSNRLFKQRFSSTMLSTVHGPCVSDKYGIFDFAYCLHSKKWITPAKKWITRSNNSWPRYDVKHNIVKHGVLFVPVGVKGSTKEELEWRISFSVGEKLLIYSFTHTQLLCYALLKILLKDIIAIDIVCEELICSYFMKTVLFWICEELPSSIWKPENLISCYMRCFRRLVYYAEYTTCPHYFIPENNLFENKIQGHAQETLLNKLNILNSYGWQCILLSDQMPNVHALAFNICKESSYLHVNSVKRLLNSVISVVDNLARAPDFCWEDVIYKVLSCRSSKIKYLYTYYMSKYCSINEQLQSFEDMYGNKSTYKQYNTCISTLLLNIRHDAVSGWLMLASFFYRRKQYNVALNIVQYSLLKCSPEKLHKCMKFSDFHNQLLGSHLFRKMFFVQLWRILLLDFVIFTNNSKLLPTELRDLKEDWIIPPVVYAHFVRFLCHYHLENSRQYWDTLRDIQLTIEENYFITGHMFKALSYNILGISFQLLGDIQSAKHAFMRSIELYPNQEGNSALQELSFIS